MRPVYDKNETIIGMTHSVENTTQYKKTEHKAKKLQHDLDILAQNFPEGSISLIDKNMTVLYTGGQGYKIYNINPTNFFGKHASEMLLPKLYRRLQEAIPQIWRGLTVSYEVDYKEKVYLWSPTPRWT